MCRRRELRHAVLAMATFLGCATAPAHAGTYYVVPVRKCSDRGAGTAAVPFCGLEAAVRRLQPGDKLVVGKGVYYERLQLSSSGAPGRPITIVGQEGAILDGSKTALDEDGLISATKVAHVVIRGLAVRSSTWYGVFVLESRDVRLEGLTVSRSEHGGIVVADAEDIKVVDNKLLEVNWKETRKKDTSIHEAISITNVKRFEVARNQLRRGLKEGIVLKDGSSSGEVHDNQVEGLRAVGIYLCHGTRVRVFRNNVHHGAASGILFATGDDCKGRRSSSDNEIFQNTVWRNAFDGLQFWRTEVGEMARNHIYNNVFYGNKHNGIVLEHTRDNRIENNIIAANAMAAFAGRGLADNTRRYNLCWKNGSRSDEGAHVIRGDPRLVKPEKGDFRLAAGSAAIDAGTSVGLAFRGKAPDLGAVER